MIFYENWRKNNVITAIMSSGHDSGFDEDTLYIDDMLEDMSLLRNDVEIQRRFSLLKPLLVGMIVDDIPEGYCVNLKIA